MPQKYSFPVPTRAERESRAYSATIGSNEPFDASRPSGTLATDHAPIKVTSHYHHRADRTSPVFTSLKNDTDPVFACAERWVKEQYTIEQNLEFLKDSLIVNALFLKSPQRIEASGLVLALMVWRLMERTMRVSLRESGSKNTGWDKKPSSRPTSLMMTRKLLSVIVLRLQGRRQLGNPIQSVQEDYLRVLGLSPDIFVNPAARLSRDAVSRAELRHLRLHAR